VTASRNPARFARVEWLALAAAMVVAHLFHWRIVRYPSDFDAQNYLDIATDIARNGLFSKFFYSNIRTYGYPLFLALLKDVAGSQPLWGWWVFEVQLALFLLAAWAARQAMALRSPMFARWAFVALILNPFVLSYTPETLSESLSLTLLIAAAACWLRARSSSSRSMLLYVLAGSAVVSYAVMVRPANVFALAAWLVAIALLLHERRARSALAIIALVAFGIILPVAPQYANNVRHYGAHTPLVVAHLGTNQQIWGIQNLKYATALAPVPLPSVFYENPLARDRPIDEAHPLRWYRDHPLAGLATMGLHVFNMLDQDLLFTYSRDLDPWYRVPVGIFNHALIGSAVVGLVLLLVRWRSRAIDVLALLAFILAYLAVHATATVEMRFGLPLLALAGPLAAWGYVQLRAQRSRALMLGAGAFVVAYVMAALMLSTWVRSQSPAIVAWQQAHSAPKE